MLGRHANFQLDWLRSGRVTGKTVKTVIFFFLEGRVKGIGVIPGMRSGAEHVGELRKKSFFCAYFTCSVLYSKIVRQIATETENRIEFHADTAENKLI